MARLEKFRWLSKNTDGKVARTKEHRGKVLGLQVARTQKSRCQSSRNPDGKVLEIHIARFKKLS
jgi:hypothetical protein